MKTYICPSLEHSHSLHQTIKILSLTNISYEKKVCCFFLISILITMYLVRIKLQKPYISLYVRCLLPGIFAFGAVYLLLPHIPIDPAASFWTFLVYAFVTGATAFLVYGALLSLLEDGLKDFANRLFHVIRRK